MGEFLSKHGLEVIYVNYPSREYGISEISERYILLKSKCSASSGKIHFVTHSAGGIVLRHFLKTHSIENLGRVVMLSPPNQGSEVADFLSRYSFFIRILGPMLLQLRTGKSSFANTLGNPNFELGVIMGDSSNDFISSFIIPGPDDGKVSVESAKIPGMKDFLLVNRTHTFLMNAPEVQTATLRFLNSGTF
nr:alpha/beta hydrolase [Leptospira santarosai]